MKQRTRRLSLAATAMVVPLSASGCTLSSNSSNGGLSGGTTTLTFWQYHSGTQLNGLSLGAVK